MFDMRLYRAALVPVILAFVVAAFSLENLPPPLTSTLAPDAFDGRQANRLLSDMVDQFPVRRPGDAGDERLAAYVASSLRQGAPGGADPFAVTVRHLTGQTIDGQQTLTNVIATRAGAPGPGLLVIAHRDAAARGAEAQLSGTAVLLELGRVFADGRLTRTMTLVSTSGGSGGNAGAAQLARSVPGPIGAVLALGDLAGPVRDRPMVVATSDATGFAPLALQRTVAAAVRTEGGLEPGVLGSPQQFARLAFPFAPGEQGTVLKNGLPAVLLQVSGERGPAADAPVSAERLASLGRVTLRAIDALDTGRSLPTASSDDLVTMDKVLPGWAIRLLVAALLIAPLLLAIDGCARARRRGGRVLVWLAWTLASALPFALAAAAVWLMGSVGALSVRPPAPVLPGVVPVDTGTFVVAGLVFLLGWVGLRPLAVRGLGLWKASPAEDGAGPAVLLLLSLAAWAIWLVNPFAAALLVLAAHLWIPILAPGVRIRWPVGLVLVVVSLVPVALVLTSVASQLGYDGAAGPESFAWALVLGIAGGQPGAAAWLLWSLAFGTAIATLIVVFRGQPPPDEQAANTPRPLFGYGRGSGPQSFGGAGGPRSSGGRR